MSRFSLALLLTLCVLVAPVSLASAQTTYNYCSYQGADFSANWTAPVILYRQGNTNYSISMCRDVLGTAQYTNNAACSGASVCQCDGPTSCYAVAQFDNSPLWSISSAGVSYVQYGSNLYCGLRREVTILWQCGANVTVLSYAEVSSCRYQFVITHPLACALQTIGSTGIDIVENYDYCSYQGLDFFTATEPVPLELYSGSTRYFLSLCADRLQQVTGSATCAGTTLCSCTSSSCTALAQLDNRASWSTLSPITASYMQLGPMTSCGFRRELTITFQCAITTSFVSYLAVTSCTSRIVVNTPLACNLPTPPPVDIPNDYANCVFAGRDFASVTEPNILQYSFGTTTSTYTFFLSMCTDRLANFTGNPACANATLCMCASNACYRAAEMFDTTTWSLISPSQANFTQVGAPGGSCTTERVTTILFSCGSTVTFTATSSSGCAYVAQVTTPLACAMSLTNSTNSTGGGFIQDYSYCSFQGTNYAGTSYPTVLYKIVGSYTYYVSMCVNRLSLVTGSATCAGASVCRCSGTTCEAMAMFDNTPTWSSPSNGVANYYQLGSSTTCSFRRQTTVQFRCGATTELYSATELSTCMYRLVVTTPLACNATNTTAPVFVDDWTYCMFAGRDFSAVTEPDILSLRDPSNSNTYFLSMCVDRLYNVTGNTLCSNATMCQCGSACIATAEMFDVRTWTFISPNHAQFRQLGASTYCSSDRVSTINFLCGVNNSFLAVAEPSTCNYVANVSTPLACGMTAPPTPSSSAPIPSSAPSAVSSSIAVSSSASLRSSSAAFVSSSVLASSSVVASSSAWASSSASEVIAESASSSMSGGAIAGAVIGAIVGLLLLIMLAVFLMRSRKSSTAFQASNPHVEMAEFSENPAHTDSDPTEVVHDAEAEVATA